ncbi:16S rRNA (adenine(1518)-N(6)/adenine(1519)-N(6)) -dimethyltransferase RsmA [Ignavibacteriales bacterium]
MKPLKRFGQNFLTDPHYINKIVDSFSPQKNDTVLEIGPGKGAITEKLLSASEDLRVVEIDTRAIELLKVKFPALQIIEGDFMDVNIREVAGNNKLRVIGNIPYNITTPIIFKLLEEREVVHDVMLMVQYEVARRITAPPGNKEYGILSVVLGVYASLEYHFKVPSTVFFPKPKVDSAIISLRFDKDESLIEDHKLFRRVVRTAFNQRRKTLRNALNPVLSEVTGDYTPPVDLGLRAEQLTIANFIELSNSLTGKFETD